MLDIKALFNELLLVRRSFCYHLFTLHNLLLMKHHPIAVLHYYKDDYLIYSVFDFSIVNSKSFLT